ncbi:MAG: hypothetical protein IH971_07220 [Candidatus Marinimicrobia bacterium]|nr:hypothetical protein [Candidatus Neomarinimicrobiota bacterium]
MAASRRNGMAAVIVHPGLMFGPGDYRKSAKMIRAVAAGKLVISLPGGTNVVDVRDVGRRIVAVLQHGLRDENYLLSGWNLTFNDIFRIIAAEVGARPPRITLPRVCGLSYTGGSGWPSRSPGAGWTCRPPIRTPPSASAISITTRPSGVWGGSRLTRFNKPSPMLWPG